MVRKAFKIFIFLLGFLLMSESTFAQGWNLVMEMVVTNDGRKMQGAVVELRKNGSLVKTFTTDYKGAVDVPVPKDGNYELTISGNGLIKKKLAVNTTNVPPEDIKGDTYFPAEVDIFPKVDGLDYKILDEPIGIIRYDSEFGGFDADLDYTRKRKAALDQLTEDYQKQKANEEKAMAAKQKEYDAIIKAADKAFASEQWELAETEYKKAAALMPLETYPSFQLAELETKLIKIRENNAKYDEAIKLADAAFASKDYQKAMAEYKRASGYKPEDAYAQDKAKESQDLLAAQVKKDQTYLAAIERGDNALKISDLNTAKTAFEEAAATKPEETYPKNKLAEINDILGKKEAKEKEYQDAIAAADEALKNSDYPLAKSNYEKALGLKPTESYPQEQIARVDELMARAAKRDQDYLLAIEQGDNALKSNDLQSALTAFNQAVEIKPEETYPANKIKEINDLIAKNEAKEKEYQDKIKEADKLLGSELYAEAKTAYEAASNLKPTEAYPKEKIGEIDGILAAQAEKEEKYNQAIAAADKAYEAKDYESAKASYTEAQGLKPDEKYPQDQLAAIGTILVKMEENKAKYDEAVKNGDEALAVDDLDAAKKFYEEAKTLKADEPYPQSKLTEIAAIIAEREKAEQSYTAAIAAADASRDAQKLEEAKAKYTEAQGIKPEESYPQEQISRIDGMLAEAAKVEEEYNTAVKRADDAMAAKDYSTAIEAYKEASTKKPNESYPKEKITEAEGLIKAAEEKEEQYAAAIAEGDKAFEKEDYESAKTAYQNALSIKEDQYPKDQIAAVDAKIAEIAAAEAAAKKLEEDYQAALNEGQAKFDAEDYAAAITAYQTASSLKPDEKLPQDKIAEIETKQKEIAEKKAEEERLAQIQKEYDAKISEADKALSAQDYQTARTTFQAALALKAEETYPKEKIEEINGILADAAEQEELYQNTIKDADDLFAKEDYEGAKSKYQEASSIKSGESYPKEKISEIDVKLADMAAAAEAIRIKKEKEEAKKKEFEALMAEGDGFAKEDEFEQAITKYEAALAVMDEQSAKDKIEEMRNKITERDAQMAEAEKAKREAEYQALIDVADKHFKSEEYSSAKTKYEEALQVKEDQYPKDQIAAIATRIAEKEQAEAAAEKEEAYNALIAEADSRFESENLTGAKEKYEEALTVKDEQYPKDQIAAIDNQIAEKEQAAATAEKEEAYNALIAEADSRFESENFAGAKAKYEEALAVKDEQYPKDQIAAIDSKLNEREKAEEMAKKEAQYQIVLAEADGLLESENLDEAESKYNEALSILDKQYPKDQLQKIADRKSELAAKESKLAAAAALEENYKNVIAAGDQAFKDKKYQDALSKYQEAISIKEGEAYPSQKIEEINGLLSAQQAKNEKESQYQNAIAAGDAAMNSEDYSTAKAEYQKALEIKANEAYPQDQIAKADQLLAEQAEQAEAIRLKRAQEAQNEAAYQTAIAEGDKLFSDKRYDEAINKYELALGLKPSKSYPAEQIQKIKKQRDEDALAAKRRAKEAEDREKRYMEIISSANKSFNEKDYALAKREYEAAKSMKPNEAYPNARINEINSILRGKELAEKKEEITDEPIQIQKGPKSTVDGSAEDEIDRMYKEMWAKNNVDKNAMIEEKREVIKQLREKEKEKENSKRLNAIQQIENISISLVEQRKTSDELHMQNFETVKNNTETIQEKELQLNKDSERKRGETMMGKDRQLEDIAEFQKEKGDGIISGKKDAVEKDYEEEIEFKKEHSQEQQKKIEGLDQEFVQKDEDIREFNKSRLDINHQQNSKVLASNQEEWKESVAKFQDGNYERTEEEKEKIYQKEIDIRKFNKEKNTEYLDGYEEVKKKTKDNEDFITEESETSLDRRMKEQEKINDIAVAKREEAMEGNEKYSENYIDVVEKTEALKEEETSLMNESEKRRQEVGKKEYYEGEDKPREDPESADYPQGVSEKIIENDNGSTTIRRIRVEGTETNIYEKTLYPWGGVFYTKNGSNITEETWDAESK